MKTLTQVVNDAIDGGYYTADGKRVMLSLQDLVDLGTVEPNVIEEVQKRLAAWRETQEAYKRREEREEL